MSRTPARAAQRGLARPVVATGIAATVLIAAGAFILSFAALADLAAMAGISQSLAWIWPVIVDGLIVAATVSIVALAGHDTRTMAYPWALLLGGAAVSTGANAVHAILAAGQSTVPPWVSAIVASMPPIILLAVTHLSVILVQKAGVSPAKKARTTPARRAETRKAEQPTAKAENAESAGADQPESTDPEQQYTRSNVMQLHGDDREGALKTAV